MKSALFRKWLFGPAESSRVRVALGSIVLAYVAVGFAERSYFGSSPWTDPDGFAVIGATLCSTGEFGREPGTLSIRRAPLYPSFLALMCWISGVNGADLAPLINGLCHFLTLLVILSHPIGKLLPLGPLALVIVGLDPLLLSYSGRTYLEPMLILSVALVIKSIDDCVRRPTAQSAVMFGAAWGLSLLVKPILFYLPLVAIPTMLIAIKSHRTIIVVLPIITAALIVAPWTLRNYSVTGQFILVQQGTTESILKGVTFARLTLEGQFSGQEEAAKKDLSRIKRRLGISALPSSEQEAHYRRYILENIRDYPTLFIKKVLIQSVSFWFLGGSWWQTLGFLALQITVLVGAAFAIAKWLPTHKRAFLGVLMVTVYLLGAHAVSLSLARYSMPLRPWLAVLALSFFAHTLTDVMNRIRVKSGAITR